MMASNVTIGKACSINKNSCVGYSEHGGSIELGDKVRIRHNVIIRSCTGRIKIGNSVVINYGCILHGFGDITIGNNSFGSETFDGIIDECRVHNNPPENVRELIPIIYASEFRSESFYVLGQKEDFIEQADIIAQTILDSANTDMPILTSTPISELISLHRLNGDALDSKGTNNGTWAGTQAYLNGFFSNDKAADFDGSSWVDLPDDTFNEHTQGTVSAQG